MTEITVTLDCRQAESMRSTILEHDYGAAVEDLEGLVTGFAPAEHLDEITAARARVLEVDEVLEEFGWETPITRAVVFSANTDYLRAAAARQLKHVCDLTASLARGMEKEGRGLIVLREEVAKITALLALLEELGEAEDR